MQHHQRSRLHSRLHLLNDTMESGVWAPATYLAACSGRGTPSLIGPLGAPMELVPISIQMGLYKSGVLLI